MEKAAKNELKRAKKCWLCKNFKFDGEVKSRDQRHFKGKCMRGAAPQSCNLNVKKGQPSFVPILSQMFRKYDSHLLIKTVINKSPSSINCQSLPTTIEIFIHQIMDV